MLAMGRALMLEPPLVIPAKPSMIDPRVQADRQADEQRREEGAKRQDDDAHGAGLTATLPEVPI